jgi:AcrR family transcriptional regulator
VVETGRRTYRSPLREEQARATRRTIVESARELFVELGYAGTTIDAVAERAGVSRKTVFTSVGGKPVLLKLAWDWALAGDDEPVPLADRPAIRALQSEQDPVRLVDAWTVFQAEIAGRLSRIHLALVAAADTDEDARALQAESEGHRLAGAAFFVRHLAEIGGLRAGLSEQRAAEIAATLMDPMPYRRLVLDAGWSFADYTSWLQRVCRASLLDD